MEGPKHVVGKVKFALVQALRFCTGRTAHRGSRGIALPFLDHGTRRGWGVSVTPRRYLPLEKPGIHCTGGWVGPRAGLDRCGKSRPPPWFDPRPVQPAASRYTDWAIRPTCRWQKLCKNILVTKSLNKLCLTIFYPYTEWHKKRELLKNPTKIEEIRKKKFIDRNWTITTCILRESNPNYQCLKITSCRWRPPPRMHSFTATTHFKSSRSFVSLRRILQSMQHTQGDTKERELLKCVVAVKECIRGGGRHLQDVIFKHW